MTNRKTTVKAEGKYTIEDMQKHASVASTADGLKLEGPNFKLTCLTACPDMLLFACEELAKANERVAELQSTVSDVELVCAIGGDKQWEARLKKFVIEKMIDALEKTLTKNSRSIAYPHGHNTNVVYSEDIKFDIEQLRKEQAHG